MLLRFDFSPYSDPESIETAKRSCENQKITLVSETPLDDGSVRITGRHVDLFGFVDRPTVRVDREGARLLSFGCGCPSALRTKRICAHCAALLLTCGAGEPLKTSASAADVIPVMTAAAPPPEEERSHENEPQIRDLSFSFRNSKEDLYPNDPSPELPYEAFAMLAGDNYVTKHLHEIGKAWTGSCFGMSAVAALFYQTSNGIDVRDFRRTATIPWQLRPDDVQRDWNMTLRGFIETVHAMQVFPGPAQARYANVKRQLQPRLKALCEAVRRFQQTGADAVMMDVWKNKRNEGGHTVLPFRYDEPDAKTGRLHIYDPNHPGKTRYMLLYRDETGSFRDWRFDMSDKTTYSSEDGGKLSFVPGKAVQTLWEDRAMPASPVLFSTDNEALSVRDENEKKVFEIRDGEILPEREDVLPILKAAGDEGAQIACWLRPGTYRVINESEDAELRFKFSQERQGIEVETRAKDVTVTVDEQAQVIAVSTTKKENVVARIFSLLGKGLQVAANIAKAVTASGTIIGFIRDFFMRTGLGEQSRIEIDGEQVPIEDTVTGEIPEALLTAHGLSAAEVSEEVQFAPEAEETEEDEEEEEEEEEAQLLTNAQLPAQESSEEPKAQTEA